MAFHNIQKVKEKETKETPNLNILEKALFWGTDIQLFLIYYIIAVMKNKADFITDNFFKEIRHYNTHYNSPSKATYTMKNPTNTN